jgi:hemoglobin
VSRLLRETSRAACGVGPLGGYDAIAAVSDDFIGRMVEDKQLARFLVGLSDSSKARLRQLVVDQLCMATGGPCLYIGRDMKTAHKGLAITGGDWELAVRYLVASLDKFKVPPKEKDEVLVIAFEPQARHRRKAIGLPVFCPINGSRVPRSSAELAGRRGG